MNEYRRRQRTWVAIGRLATLPPLVGAISVLADTGGGLRWLAVGTPLASLAGVGEAWVLLVEIQR